MKIYLIRHGEAVERGTDLKGSDEYRFLTAEGRKTSRNVAGKLKTELKEVELIITSPYVRAVQTAEITAVCSKYKGDIIIGEELTPENSVSRVTRLLERNKGVECIALVGHDPLMSMLVSALGGKSLSFKKSGVACIDYDISEGKGRMEWYFNPKTMSKE